MEALGDEPKLRVVEESSLSSEGEHASGTSASPPSGGEKPRRSFTGRVWLWALLGLLVGLGFAYQQYSRAEELVVQVETLNASLLEAQLQIQAYDKRFRDVRTRVGELDQRMDALKRLVDADPLQPVPAPGRPEPVSVAPGNP